MMRKILPVPLVILLVACGASEGDGAAGTAPAGSGTAPESAPRDERERADPGPEIVTEPQPDTAAGGWTATSTERADPAAGIGTLSAIRIASHDRHDRIVIEFSDEVMPGYTVDLPGGPLVRCGSGLPVELTGEAILRIRMEPARAHTDEGEPTLSQRRWQVALPVVQEVLLTCDFEAQVELVAALRSSNSYRVLELTEPTRLVIDVRRD